MQGDVRHTVVPNSYVEGGLQQLASGRGQAYQGFLPANMAQQQQQQDTDSSRSPENLHSPPEPAGSSYSSSVFVSVSKGRCPALQPSVEHRVLLLLITHSYLLPALLQHMLAGAVAGITEHTAMYPVDTIKTRMQALSHPGQRVSSEAAPGVLGYSSCLSPDSTVVSINSTVAVAAHETARSAQQHLPVASRQGSGPC